MVGVSIEAIGSETGIKPIYNYVSGVIRLIPVLGNYYTPEEAQKIAQAKAEEISKIRRRMPARGGRAG